MDTHRKSLGSAALACAWIGLPAAVFSILSTTGAAQEPSGLALMGLVAVGLGFSLRFAGRRGH